MARGSRRHAGVYSVANYLFRMSVNRGLIGQSRFWRTLFRIGFGRLVLGKLLAPTPKTISVKELKPGQALSIAAVDARVVEPGRRRRRG